MTNTEKDVLKSDEVAELLEISPLTVREWAKKGKIPARKIGKEWRFSKAAIMKWLEGEQNQ